jgi:hypothetical protein
MAARERSMKQLTAKKMPWNTRMSSQNGFLEPGMELQRLAPQAKNEIDA